MPTASTWSGRTTDEVDLLSDRVVLVTGASRGLGRAYATHAASLGAHVVVNDIDEMGAEAVVHTIRRADQSASFVGGSVATWDEATSVVERSVDVLGGLHGVVANAGIFSVGDPWDATDAQLDALLAVNVVGTIAVGVAAMGHLPRGGSIVTVTSGAASGMSGMSLYGATKGAVASVTASWAIDLAPRGIRVNCISPVAETRLTDIGRTRLGDTPTQPSPETVAPVVSHLLGRGSEHLTGRVFRVDGSWVSLVEGLRPVAKRQRGRLDDMDDVAACLDSLVAT